MKNSMKFLVGGLAAVVVLGAAYFGAGGGLQGKLQGSQSVTKAELAVLVWDVIKDSFSWNYSGANNDCVYYDDIKGDETYAVAACNLGTDYILGVSNTDKATGESTYIFDPNANVTRKSALKTFLKAYQFGKTGNSIIAFPLDGTYKELPPYLDLYKDEYSGYKVYEAFCNAGIPEVKCWANLKFLPESNLTKSRAQVWANNLKKALNK